MKLKAIFIIVSCLCACTHINHSERNDKIRINYNNRNYLITKQNDTLWADTKPNDLVSILIHCDFEHENVLVILKDDTLYNAQRDTICEPSWGIYVLPSYEVNIKPNTYLSVVVDGKKYDIAYPFAYKYIDFRKKNDSIFIDFAYLHYPIM